MNNLWASNHPRNFWQVQPDFPDEIWDKAFIRALPSLGLTEAPKDINSLLEFTLGEAQFGTNRYRLGPGRRFYYLVKPLIPRAIIRRIRLAYNSSRKASFSLNWPIEPRYAQFLWEALRQGLILSGQSEITFRYFWPESKKFAVVLTHDVETAEGQRRIPILADMEESLGFRSMFNFVPEQYQLDRGLIDDLQKRGFEIGLHGLKHDGKLFNSYHLFSQLARNINCYLAEFQSTSFRSPLTLRNPAWMQMLEIDQDLSFFDTDPYEPMPGGTMSIWPFMIGHFVELPYTLPQDFTLFNLMGETSPKLWLEKIDFLEKYHGMALGNVHPDYSGKGLPRKIYESFLCTIRERQGYWHALPGKVAKWWKARFAPNGLSEQYLMAHAIMTTDGINVEPPLTKFAGQPRACGELGISCNLLS